MKKKTLQLLIGGSCLVFVLVVLGLPLTSTAAEITLRLSNGLAPGTFQNTTLLPAFTKEVKEKTGGKVIVELYPAGQLYGHIETAEALHRGGVEMGFLSVNHWVGYNPIFGWNDYPFLVKDLDHFKQREDKLFPITQKSLEKINAKLLSFVPYSSTCLASRSLIEKPTDVKGLRIRGVSDPFFDAVKAWGGVPAAMSPSEMYDALAKGALGGALTGWESVQKRKLYEVTKYVAGTTSASIWGIFINLKTWNKLPQNVKSVMEEAAKNVHEKAFGEQKKIDEGARKFLEERGGVHVKLFTSEEKAIWSQATKPAYDMYLKRCTDKGSGDTARVILELFE
jgi:C4-dicarboxylate-binding protein DctP